MIQDFRGSSQNDAFNLAPNLCEQFFTSSPDSPATLDFVTLFLAKRVDDGKKWERERRATC